MPKGYEEEGEGEGDLEDEGAPQGYCHYNSGGEDSLSFTLRMFHHDITLVQDPSSTVGHGAVIWDAAVVMAKWLEYSNPKLFQNISDKTVLELGSGCGLGGISFMLKGSLVTFTDMSSVVQTILARNVSHVYKKLTSQGTIGGFPILEPKVFPLDWSFSESEQRASGILESGYDYILLTDCVFSTRLAPFLVATILRCSHAKTIVLCCHEIRDEEANTAFVTELSKHFHIKRVARCKLHPEYKSDFIEIFTGRRIRTSVLACI